MSKIELSTYNSVFLNKSWIWLNDPEIKYLTNTGDFSKEDQQKWFSNLPNLEGYKIWGVIYNKEPIGVFGIKNIKNSEGEYWGYIGEKKYWGAGLGREIMEAIIIEAYKLKLENLYLKVIPENERAIKLYKKMGFEIETQKSLANMLIMRKIL